MQQDNYQVYSSEIINFIITEWGAEYPFLREELKIAMNYKAEMSTSPSSAAAETLGYIKRCFTHAWHQSSPNTPLTAGKIPPGTQPRFQHCTLMPPESPCTPRWWQKSCKVTARREWSTSHGYGQSHMEVQADQITSFATRGAIYCVPPQ